MGRHRPHLLRCRRQPTAHPRLRHHLTMYWRHSGTAKQADRWRRLERRRKSRGQLPLATPQRRADPISRTMSSSACISDRISTGPFRSTGHVSAKEPPARATRTASSASKAYDLPLPSSAATVRRRPGRRKSSTYSTSTSVDGCARPKSSGRGKSPGLALSVVLILYGGGSSPMCVPVQPAMDSTSATPRPGAVASGGLQRSASSRMSSASNRSPVSPTPRRLRARRHKEVVPALGNEPAGVGRRLSGAFSALLALTRGDQVVDDRARQDGYLAHAVVGAIDATVGQLRPGSEHHRCRARARVEAADLAVLKRGRDGGHVDVVGHLTVDMAVASRRRVDSKGGRQPCRLKLRPRGSVVYVDDDSSVLWDGQ